MRLLSGLIVLALATAATAAEPRGLNIYFADVEGGAATLIVTPAGESILIDCGNPGNRDADRIAAVAKDWAKITTIDHLILTHWHIDHYGGIERLATLMPIKHYYHHTMPETLPEDPKYPVLIGVFKKLSEGKRTQLRPGDTVPLRQAEGAPRVEIRCVCADKDVVPDAPGAAKNPIADDHKPQKPDPTDNANSLGFVVSFGAFRFLDLGDLTWNIEYKLVHPSDKLGPIDVYQSTHHGLEVSNNPVVMRTVAPRVAIFNNGPKKGAHPQVIGNLRRLPQPPVIYQMHRNVTVGPAENTDADLIANDAEKCNAEAIQVSVAPDSKTYTVTVGKAAKSRQYQTRAKE